MESASAGRLIYRPANQRTSRCEGFSLLEMMVVVTVILIVASMSAPLYMTAMVRPREAVLADDLFTLRSLVDRFTLDNGRAPSGLQELVTGGYLGRIPTDPFTGSEAANREQGTGNREPGKASKRRRGLRMYTAARTSFPSKARRTTRGSAAPALRPCGFSKGGLRPPSVYSGVLFFTQPALAGSGVRQLAAALSLRELARLPARWVQSTSCGPASKLAWAKAVARCRTPERFTIEAEKPQRKGTEDTEKFNLVAANGPRCATPLPIINLLSPL